MKRFTLKSPSFIILFSIILCLCTGTVYGQTRRTVDLNEVLSNGSVTLTSRGNGSSTGMAVDGSLRNNTSREINVNVVIRDGLYLVNSGVGQNMIALQVFQSGGRFHSSGGSRHIRLPANSTTQVSFIALCGHFDRANPARTENFSVSSMPALVRTIVSRISHYLENNFGKDLSTAAQIALWRTHDLSRSRALTREEISRTFPVSDENWRISTEIMNSRAR